MTLFAIKKTLYIILICLLLFSAVGCEGKKSSVDSSDTVAAMDKTPYVSQTPSDKGLSKVIVYYVTSHGMYFYPETVTVEPVEFVAQKALEVLIKGPDHELGKSPIPYGTKLNGIYIEDKTAFVDFSEEFLRAPYNLSILESFKIEAVVRTLCEFEDIEEVQILVNGSAPDQYDLPMKPTKGLNQESSSQPFNRSIALTVYYADKSKRFLIPVTIHLKVTSSFKPSLKNMCELALNQLLKVPEGNKYLTTTLPKDVKFQDLYIINKTVYVDINRNILIKYNSEEIDKKLLVNSIVYTLGSLPGIESVQFLIDGKPMGIVMDGINLSRPILPARWINENI